MLSALLAGSSVDARMPTDTLREGSGAVNDKCAAGAREVAELTAFVTGQYDRTRW